MALFFVFIDGIGVGENTEENPLASDKLTSFSFFTGNNGFHKECTQKISDRYLYKEIDANLGIKGLPQSGTGQTTLFSGKNASVLLGRHFGPYPHTKIKPLLRKDSLFHQVLELDKQPHFLNAYPDIFFEKSKKRNRWSCTTLMVRSSGVRLNRLEDIQEGKAITAEIIQSAWRNMLGLDVPKIKPEEAGQRALHSLKEFDFILYEYYLTDKAGHSQDQKRADKVLSVLDRFLVKVMINLDESDTLVITSDHGNLEDLSTKSHTRNPVPLFVKGDVEPFENVESIIDITPTILEAIK